MPLADLGLPVRTRRPRRVVHTGLPIFAIIDLGRPLTVVAPTLDADVLAGLASEERAVARRRRRGRVLVRGLWACHLRLLS